MTLHFGFIIALIAAVIVWWILRRSKWGFEVKLTGDNPHAARYAGVNITRNIVLVMMFSGALAGLAGMTEDYRGCASFTGTHLTRIRIYGNYHCLVGQTESICRRSRIHPIWGADRRRT